MRGQREDEQTRAQWRTLIAEAARSGRSIRVFCQERGVTEGQFYAWRRRWAGLNLRLENVRWEQAEGSGGYFLDIEHNHYLYNLLLQNCFESVEGNGVKLRKVRTTTFRNVYYPNITGGTALDVDATVYLIILDNSGFQVRTVLQTPGLTKVFDLG